MRANRGSPKDTWVELMEARDGEKIEDVDIFKVRSTPSFERDNIDQDTRWTNRGVFS